MSKLQEVCACCGAQAGSAALEQLQRVLRGMRGRVRQRHAQRLGRARHGVGGVHASARARARARVAHDVSALALIDQVCGPGACVGMYGRSYAVK